MPSWPTFPPRCRAERHDRLRVDAAPGAGGAGRDLAGIAAPVTGRLLVAHRLSGRRAAGAHYLPRHHGRVRPDRPGFGCTARNGPDDGAGGVTRSAALVASPAHRLGARDATTHGDRAGAGGLHRLRRPVAPRLGGARRPHPPDQAGTPRTAAHRMGRTRQRASRPAPTRWRTADAGSRPAGRRELARTGLPHRAARTHPRCHPIRQVRLPAQPAVWSGPATGRSRRHRLQVGR